MGGDTYTCAFCGGTFDKGRSDDEAMAESAERFGARDPSDLAVVCDDCFQRMEAAYPASHFLEDEAAEIERAITLPTPDR